MSLTLPPELNTGPSPVRITTRTPGSRRTASQACTNSATAVLPVRALRVAGWLMVRMRTAPSRSDLRKGVESIMGNSGGVWRESSCQRGRVGELAQQVEGQAFVPVHQRLAQHALPVRFAAAGLAPGVQAARVELQIELSREADGAMDRMPQRRHLGCGLAATGLGQGGAQRIGRLHGALATQAGRHARGKHQFGHHAELVLDGLELADRAAELLALVGVL